MKNCPYLKIIKNGFTQTTECSVDKEPCYFVRMCGERRTLVSSNKSINCIKRNKEEI